MKIAIGSRPYDGPWGGGNRFVVALCEALAREGHTVVHDLKGADIDFIVMIDPRVRAPNVCFGAGAIARYLTFRNARAIVVHRVNECDERKGERFINDRLARANAVADATVFVGEWLMRLPVWRAHRLSRPFVIRNGADQRLFNTLRFSPWSGQGALKLVTHHWGYHPMKGFDVYAKLDAMLNEPRWKQRIAFTYVGNLPKGFRFAHARYVPPLDGTALAAELSQHHAYITASLNEPGGNHQNEGALCGLPLLYRLSGCMPEYCEGFGVAFAGPEDVEDALEKLIAGYPALAARMPSYPNTAERMTAEWLKLFGELAACREAIVSRRNLWRRPFANLVNQIPF